MVNKLLIFDLTGKFACWKKFYSNSSSFTYEIPSRTHLIGLLASILELPRDSYYDEFSSENCKISLSLKTNIKKKFYCLNYFKKPNQRDYTQVRLELLSPLNIQNELIRYRVYIYLKNEELFKKLRDKIKKRDFGYGVYLGQRQFKGDISFIDELNENQIKEVEEIDSINTIVNLSNINKKEDFTNTNYIIDKIPMDFNFVGTSEEKNTNKLNREIKRVNDIVFTNKPSQLVNNSYFKKALELDYQDNCERICFYEEF